MTRPRVRPRASDRTVLWATLGGSEVASSRVRVHQLSDALTDRGWRSRVELGVGLRGRATVLLRLVIDRPRVVVVQKILYDALALWAIRRLAPVLVFECDDAVHLGYPDATDDDRRTTRARIERIRRTVDIVTTTNEVLARELAPRSGRVLHYPGPGPSQRGWDAAGEREKVLIWLGSPSTTRYLHLVPELAADARARGWTLIAIGASDDAAGLGWQVEPWSFGRQNHWLARASVGVMPQLSDQWSDRKAAYKVLEYAAAGVVPVASDVRPARELMAAPLGQELLLQPGADWAEAVDRAHADRKKYIEALRTVRDRYSAARVAEDWETTMTGRSI